MSSKIFFYVVRHGKTLLNTLERVQGWCDSPLTPEGIEAAQDLGAGLKEIAFDAAYTSDLRRTRQTAELILKEKGQAELPVTELEGLREACFGGYESDCNHKMWRDAALYLHYTDEESMSKDVFAGKISNHKILDAIQVLDKMGMAESYAQVEKRTQDALFGIAQKEAENGRDKNILVVSHGMSIICMLSSLGGNALLKNYLDNAAVCLVEYSDGHFTIRSMGDMSYMQQGRKRRQGAMQI
jgi:probable phosphoglycerate mutase